MPTRSLEETDEFIDQCPVLSDGFLAWLEQRFPRKPPAPDTTERADLYHAGERNVVAVLREVQKHQQNRGSQAP